MIAPMKKVTIVVLDSKRRDSVEALRDFGLVHLEGLSGTSPVLDDTIEKAAVVAKALQNLPKSKKKPAVPKGRALDDVLASASEIAAAADELHSLKAEMDRLDQDERRQAPWGDFEPGDAEILRQAGYVLKIYEIPKKEYKSFRPEGLSFVAFRKKDLIGVACLGKKDAVFPDFGEIALPSRSLHEIRSLKESKRARVKELESKLAELAVHRSELQEAEKNLEGFVEFEQVAAGMMAAEKVSYVNGYIPSGKIEQLKKAASGNGWGLLARDPGPEDTVPTLVENPKWVQIVQPIFSLLGLSPGYKEVDISMIFLVFFTFFFAMIIGDAGYGTLFFGCSVFFFIKEKRTFGSPSRAAILLVLLNFATIVWGAVTGVWFGSSVLNKNPLLSWMVVPGLDGFVDANASTIKLITFIVGLTHLTLARLWSFFRELKGSPKIRCLAQVGWLLVIWGMFSFVLYFVLDPKKYAISDISIRMILVGYALIMILGQQQGDGFFKGILRGLAGLIPTTLSTISVFGDIVSYIRLFAVGLAAVEIAKAFNGMATGFLSLGVWGLIPMVLLFVLGHGLNMALSVLAVVVHGVRLNLLEFSNHLGLEWSGIAYQPFRKKHKITL